MQNLCDNCTHEFATCGAKVTRFSEDVAVDALLGDTVLECDTYKEATSTYAGMATGISEEFTGSNVNYYLVDVPEPKRLAPYRAECEDIMEALGMTFAEGCAFKAIWRSCAARTLGLAKKGQDPHGVYDAEKVQYYGARMVAARRRLPST